MQTFNFGIADANTGLVIRLLEVDAESYGVARMMAENELLPNEFLIDEH
jgi:hypothetical protein